MSLESDGHGQVSHVFKNLRESFAFLGLIASCLVYSSRRKSVKQSPSHYLILEYVYLFC